LITRGIERRHTKDGFDAATREIGQIGDFRKVDRLRWFLRS
jgi:hypothetical protein